MKEERNIRSVSITCDSIAIFVFLSLSHDKFEIRPLRFDFLRLKNLKLKSKRYAIISIEQLHELVTEH